MTTARHPLVVELFRVLPPPGSVWPAEERVLWFEAMGAVLAMLYPVRGVRIEIGAPSVHVVKARVSDLAELLSDDIGRRAEPREPVKMPAPIATSIEEHPAQKVAAPPAPDVVPSVDVADLVAPRFSPSKGIVIEPKGRTGQELSPRPAGIPTTFAMLQEILLEHPGQLTARETVEKMAGRWWPELEFQRVAPDISTWITKGRIRRDADGKLALTEQGQNIASVDHRKPPNAPPPPPAAQPREAAIRFAEARARMKEPAKAPEPAAKPVAPEPVDPPRDATIQFDYGGKAVLVSLREHRVLSKLKAAMGKGMLDGAGLVSAAFAGTATRVTNSEIYLAEMVRMLEPRLGNLGLEMVAVPVMPGSSRIAGYVLRAK